MVRARDRLFAHAANRGKRPATRPSRSASSADRASGIIRYRGSSDCRILIASQTHHDRGSRTSTRSL